MQRQYAKERDRSVHLRGVPVPVCKKTTKHDHTFLNPKFEAE